MWQVFESTSPLCHAAVPRWAARADKGRKAARRRPQPFDACMHETWGTYNTLLRSSSATSPYPAVETCTSADLCRRQKGVLRWLKCPSHRCFLLTLVRFILDGFLRYVIASSGTCTRAARSTRPEKRRWAVTCADAPFTGTGAIGCGSDDAAWRVGCRRAARPHMTGRISPFRR